MSLSKTKVIEKYCNSVPVRKRRGARHQSSSWAVIRETLAGMWELPLPELPAESLRFRHSPGLLSDVPPSLGSLVSAPLTD